MACVPKVPLPGGPIAVGGRGPGSCEDAYVEGLPLGGGPDSDCLAAMDSLGCWCVLGLVHRGSGGHPGSTRHPVLGAGRGRGRDGRDAFGVVAALVADAPARPGREFPGLGTRDGGTGGDPEEEIGDPRLDDQPAGAAGRAREHERPFRAPAGQSFTTARELVLRLHGDGDQGGAGQTAPEGGGAGQTARSVRRRWTDAAGCLRQALR